MKLELNKKKASSDKQKDQPKESTDELLKKFPNIFQIADRGKLLCTITKHELPPNELSNYVLSKKFMWEWKIHQIMEQYGEHFDNMGPGVLACRVTLRTVARDPADLERHVNGKRFTKELPIYLEKVEADKQKEIEKQKAADKKEKDRSTMEEFDKSVEATEENEVEVEEKESLIRMGSGSSISEHIDDEDDEVHKATVSKCKKRKALEKMESYSPKIGHVDDEEYEELEKNKKKKAKSKERSLIKGKKTKRESKPDARGF